MGHYDSKSEKQFEMIWKTTLAQFSNTAVILFVLKFYGLMGVESGERNLTNIWGETGLIK